MIKLEHKKSVYELWSTDGYTQNHIAYFAVQADAESICYKLNGGNKYGYYGVTDKYIPSLVIFESVAEYEGYKTQSIKDAALKKLTKEEKQALGLL